MASIGIIIPCYNSARFLPRALQSVRVQSFTDWKCVIVDDCSSDATLHIAESAGHEDTRFSLLALPENRGASAARNAGLAALGRTVRFVIFLDSDDLWNASALQSLVDAMEAHPLWCAVYGDCRVIDSNGKYVPNEGIEFAGRKRFDCRDGQLVQVGNAETTFSQLLVRNPIVSPGCMLIRSEVIADVTGQTSRLFDPAMKYGEDLAAWFQIRRVGIIGYVNNAVLDYRMHCSNASNRRLKMALGVRKVRLQALQDPTLQDQEFHHACCASRAYRRDRAQRELRSAATCLYYRQYRAAGCALGCAVASRLDVLISLALQAGRFARTLARHRQNTAGSETSDNLDSVGHLDAVDG